MPYKYLIDNLDFPYCDGCGHTFINKKLADAFAKMDIKPSKINLVSDIGCVGLVDKMFLTNTIHTTHGRSAAFATGLQLADQILFDNDAIHVVMIGDGGSTIGLLHLVEAAKMNANITVILHNNFVYGMTGGQNSGLTPENFRTATTMSGAMVPNIHIVNLLAAAHGGFLARKLATDKDLDDTIVEAIKYPGFSLVEVVELCTGYAIKWNSLAKKDIETILENSDSGERGTLVKRNDRENFGSLYAKNFPKKELQDKIKTIEKRTIQDQIKLDIVISGSAGEGIQFAAKTLIEAALKQGANVMQKNDNPVTIGTGFSMSEVKISSDEILYSGITSPDYLLIGSLDGFNRAQEFIKNTINEKAKSTIIIDSTLVEKLDKYDGFTVIPEDFRKQASSDTRLVNFLMFKKLYEIESKLNLEDLLETIKANKNSEAITKIFAKI